MSTFFPAFKTHRRIENLFNVFVLSYHLKFFNVLLSFGKKICQLYFNTKHGKQCPLNFYCQKVDKHKSDKHKFAIALSYASSMNYFATNLIPFSIFSRKRWILFRSFYAATDLCL
jgi:hypothetical protein